ncbi:hypothetical protein RvY_00192-2 [Ramazzottius varieornatus]|uniref:Uncharacterized protein n=1 Tax=Ramazzottius varieornatus TaxID=947166 RepID=A0A1D1UCC3_RAMVA|nr:hypothetical protein RvY_00192-2 [Ramazzottius varieornatus]
MLLCHRYIVEPDIPSFLSGLRRQGWIRWSDHHFGRTGRFHDSRHCIGLEWQIQVGDCCSVRWLLPVDGAFQSDHALEGTVECLPFFHLPWALYDGLPAGRLRVCSTINAACARRHFLWTAQLLCASLWPNLDPDNWSYHRTRPSQHRQRDSGRTAGLRFRSNNPRQIQELAQRNLNSHRYDYRFCCLLIMMRLSNTQQRTMAICWRHPNTRIWLQLCPRLRFCPYTSVMSYWQTLCATRYADGQRV